MSGKDGLAEHFRGGIPENFLGPGIPHEDFRLRIPFDEPQGHLPNGELHAGFRAAGPLFRFDPALISARNKAMASPAPTMSNSTSPVVKITVRRALPIAAPQARASKSTPSTASIFPLTSRIGTKALTQVPHSSL